MLVAPDYPDYEKFAKLSRQEADWGLLEALRKDSGGDSLCVSTHRRGCLKCLEDHCAELKGHRVVRQKDTYPYRMKLGRDDRQNRTAFDHLRGKNLHQKLTHDSGGF